MGTEREPCTAQRIPSRECPRTSKRRKIKRNPEQAVNIVLGRRLFSSPEFMDCLHIPSCITVVLGLPR